MFFKNKFDNLLLLIAAVVLIILCNCKNIAGFETTDEGKREEMNQYFTSVRNKQSDLSREINNLVKDNFFLEMEDLTQVKRKENELTQEIVSLRNYLFSDEVVTNTTPSEEDEEDEVVTNIAPSDDDNRSEALLNKAPPQLPPSPSPTPPPREPSFFEKLFGGLFGD